MSQESRISQLVEENGRLRTQVEALSADLAKARKEIDHAYERGRAKGWKECNDYWMKGQK